MFPLSHYHCTFLNLLLMLRHRAEHTQKETQSPLFHIQELRRCLRSEHPAILHSHTCHCCTIHKQTTLLTDNYIPDIQLSSDMGTSRYIRPLLYRPLKGKKQKTSVRFDVTVYWHFKYKSTEYLHCH